MPLLCATHQLQKLISSMQPTIFIESTQ